MHKASNVLECLWWLVVCLNIVIDSHKWGTYDRDSVTNEGEFYRVSFMELKIDNKSKKKVTSIYIIYFALIIWEERGPVSGPGPAPSVWRGLGPCCAGPPPWPAANKSSSVTLPPRLSTWPALTTLVAAQSSAPTVLICEAGRRKP